MDVHAAMPSLSLFSPSRKSLAPAPPRFAPHMPIENTLLSYNESPTPLTVAPTAPIAPANGGK